jgi:hypothetical protein
MTTKVFAEQGSFKLIGDSRGFIIPVKDRTAYANWCRENDIKTEYQGSMNNVDLWYVKDDNHRMLALLRWS